MLEQTISTLLFSFKEVVVKNKILWLKIPTHFILKLINYTTRAML